MKWSKGGCLACDGTGWIKSNWGSSRCSCNPYPVQEQVSWGFKQTCPKEADNE